MIEMKKMEKQQVQEGKQNGKSFFGFLTKANKVELVQVYKSSKWP